MALPDFTFDDLLKGSVLLIDKPLTWTSFDIVNKLRWKITKKAGIKKLKVGHAGTLDPLATGLLIICTGKMTTQIDQYQSQAKTYSGIIELGAETPSYDLETEIFQRAPLPENFKAALEAARLSFLGDQMQLPPIFSAIKQGGKRLYEFARAGKDTERVARPVQISQFDLDASNLPEVHFTLACGKGTYVRSIAHDLGAKLGCGGYLKSLRRTGNGEFSVDDAWDFNELLQYIDALEFNPPS